MDLEGKIEELVLRHLPDERYFVTEIRATPAGPHTKVSIYIDGDEGVDIDVCAQVSRKVGHDLESLEVMDHPYTLMVSSPGLDRPLKLPRQYHRNCGKELKIRLKNQQEIKAKLREVQEDFIVVDELSFKKEKIPFSEIESTYVLVSF